MNNYIELTREESLQISNVSCQEEMDSVLSKYALQVFKVVNVFEDEQSFSYYLAETERELKEVDCAWINRLT
jgi:hypothetical protein